MTYAESAAPPSPSGKNCAQKVLGACCRQIGLDPETAIRLTAFLGGGLRRGEVCGAAVSALLALGMAYGDENNRTCTKSLEFLDAFTARYSALRCRDLTGPNGEYRSSLCPGIIAWTTAYLEEEFQ